MPFFALMQPVLLGYACSRFGVDPSEPQHANHSLAHASDGTYCGSMCTTIVFHIASFPCCSQSGVEPSELTERFIQEFKQVG